MKVYVFLDESGHIHANSTTQYFAIGGYCVCEYDKDNVKRRYKKENLKIKNEYGFDRNEELKATKLNQEQKIRLFNKIQDISSFCGIALVFDKSRMRKAFMNENIFFNYGVRVLIDDIVFPLFNMEEEIEFLINIDNRNISVGNLNDLETYLNTEFVMENCKFTVHYWDSKNSYEVQIADLVVNTAYMRKKDRSMVDQVLKCWKRENFSLSVFPGKRHNGRVEKLSG